MKNKNHIKIYLEKYAEPETNLLDELAITKVWDKACVLPMYNETTESIAQFDNYFDSSTLLVVILNQPDSDKDTNQQQKICQWLNLHFTCSWKQGNLSLFQNNINLLLVDRFNNPIPSKMGVGLARKIGFDLCCKLFSMNLLHCHFVGSTDADATLTKNYFKAIEKISPRYSAICYDYKHTNDNSNIALVTQWYEASLKFYSAGLKFAGSKYAYHTIGSAIAVNLNHYAAVRGFPTRSAGEDFYLLNKLRKIGEILEIDEIIQLKPRVSLRVPFGTGPKVNQLLNSIENDLAQELQNGFYYYDPQVFQLLQEFINTYALDKIGFVENWDYRITHTLKLISYDRFINHCQRLNAKENQILYHFFIWFDAFKQLKFVRHLTNNYFSMRIYTRKDLININLNK